MPLAQQPLILVIDDDEGIRGLLSDILTDAGYAVVAARDGRSALAALRTARPVLITLDMEIPGIDGSQLLLAIRQSPITHTLAVLVISAQDSLPSHVRELAQAIVRKPFDVDRVLHLVGRFVQPAPVERYTSGARIYQAA